MDEVNGAIDLASLTITLNTKPEHPNLPNFWSDLKGKVQKRHPFLFASRPGEGKIGYGQQSEESPPYHRGDLLSQTDLSFPQTDGKM